MGRGFTWSYLPLFRYVQWIVDWREEEHHISDSSWCHSVLAKHFRTYPIFLYRFTRCELIEQNFVTLHLLIRFLNAAFSWCTDPPFGTRRKGWDPTNRRGGKMYFFVRSWLTIIDMNQSKHIRNECTSNFFMKTIVIFNQCNNICSKFCILILFHRNEINRNPNLSINTYKKWNTFHCSKLTRNASFSSFNRWLISSFAWMSK